MKKCTFGKEWLMGSEMRMGVFSSSKNRLFQSSWIFQQMFPIVFGTALGSCFSLWMILNLPSSFLKKINFFIKKTFILIFELISHPLPKKRVFFHRKKDFFQRRWREVENHSEAETRPQSRSEYNRIKFLKFQEFWKNRFFWWKKRSFSFLTP